MRVLIDVHGFPADISSSLFPFRSLYANACDLRDSADKDEEEEDEEEHAGIEINVPKILGWSRTMNSVSLSLSSAHFINKRTAKFKQRK